MSLGNSVDHGGTIRKAILVTHPEDWGSLLELRTSPGETTGFYPNTAKDELDDLIWNAEWIPYRHPTVPDGNAYSTPLPGQLMIAYLPKVPDTTLVTFESTDEPDLVSAVVSGVPGRSVQYTVIVLYPAGSLDPSEMEVRDFHPGAPTRPSQVKAPELLGQTMSVQEAVKLGFILAKIKQP